MTEEALNKRRINSEIKFEREEIKRMNTQLKLNTIEELRLLLSTHVINFDPNVSPGEETYKPIILGDYRAVISKKIASIIDTL